MRFSHTEKLHLPLDLDNSIMEYWYEVNPVAIQPKTTTELFPRNRAVKDLALTCTP
eukprot:c32925_g1_i1 orf=306-473(-)